MKTKEYRGAIMEAVAEFVSEEAKNNRHYCTQLEILEGIKKNEALMKKISGRRKIGPSDNTFLSAIREMTKNGTLVKENKWYVYYEPLPIFSAKNPITALAKHIKILKVNYVDIILLITGVRYSEAIARLIIESAKNSGRTKKIHAVAIKDIVLCFNVGCKNSNVFEARIDKAISCFNVIYKR